MKFITSIFFIILSVFSDYSSADTKVLSLDGITAFDNPIYPGLDLSGVRSGKLIVETNGTDIVNIKRLELDFPRASNLIITNFQPHNGGFKALSSNGWVFKKIAARVYMQSYLSDFQVRLSVVDNQDILNDLNSTSGAELLEFNATMKDITHNPLADMKSTMYEDSKLTLKLYRDTKFNETGSKNGFVIDAIRLGAGTGRYYYPVSLTAKAIALTITEEQGFKLFSIRYQESDGSVFETGPELIKTLFEQY